MLVFLAVRRKRYEILQMALLEPSMAVLDETDSGLDVDALRIVSEGVNALRGDTARYVGHHPLSALAVSYCARPCAYFGKWTYHQIRR